MANPHIDNLICDLNDGSENILAKDLSQGPKGQPGALKLPHTQGSGEGPTIWCIVRSLTLFLHKRLFPRLEPVTFQSHDNNFTSCAKVTPLKKIKQLSGV